MRAAILLCAVALAGCAQQGPERTLEEVRRAYARTFLPQPFAEGAVHVVAAERGEMKTYLLVPCRGGTAICAGGLHGRPGTLTAGPDYVTVTGAYPGRSFLLAPGGSGVLLRHGARSPLAWD